MRLRVGQLEDIVMVDVLLLCFFCLLNYMIEYSECLLFYILLTESPSKNKE